MSQNLETSFFDLQNYVSTGLQAYTTLNYFYTTLLPFLEPVKAAY